MLSNHCRTHWPCSAAPLESNLFPPRAGIALPCLRHAESWPSLLVLKQWEQAEQILRRVSLLFLGRLLRSLLCWSQAMRLSSPSEREKATSVAPQSSDESKFSIISKGDILGCAFSIFYIFASLARKSWAWFSAQTAFCLQEMRVSLNTNFWPFHYFFSW